MVKYRRISNKRPKAFAGESIVAAGIGAAATLASAAISSAATTAGAKRQALAQSQAAQTQAEALKKQNDNANKLQEKQIEFTQKQNEQNRDLQNQIQMNLQMLAGQQNENERLDAARIQVKKGGSARRNNLSSFGFGIDGNMPFQVTDGGTAIPLGLTKEGYGLYMLRGDNHEEYHRTKGGNLKSGVGIKAATGQVVEGEGGKFLQGGRMNTVGRGEGSTGKNPGELMMTTPNDILFISKHKLGGNAFGYNPTLAVLSGQDDPTTAYKKQEYIKAVDSSPVKKNKHKAGGNSVALFDLSNPIDFSTDTIAPTVGGFEYLYNQQRQKQKCGGRVKKYSGGRIYNPFLFQYNPIAQTDVPVINTDGLSGAGKAGMQVVLDNPPRGGMSNTNVVSGSNNQNRSLSTDAANYIGAGINTLGNIGGSIINSIGNRIASRYAAQGLKDATRATIEGARRLKGIDPNLIKNSDYRAAHAMVALNDPRVNVNPDIALIDRSLQRQRENTARYIRSGAAALNRLATAETNTYDMRSKVYDRANQLSQKIKEGNVEALNRASLYNAQLDTQANQQALQARLDVAKYNNDIANQKIGLEYGALANQATGLAGINSNRAQANAQTWAGTLANTGNSFANAMMTNAKMKQDRQNLLLGANDEAISRYLSQYGTQEEVDNMLAAIGDNPTDESGKRQKRRLEHYKALQGWS